MYPSHPFFLTSVSNTPLLVFRNTARMESLEVSNPNTSQAFVQLFNALQASDVKLNVTFTVDSTTDIFTATAHGLVNRTALRVFNTGGALPSGLAVDTVYYVINATTDTFQLSTQKDGSAIDIATNGSGTNSFTSHLIQSYLVPAGDGTNDGAVSKEWPHGLFFPNGICLCVTTTQTGSTAPSSACRVQGTYW